MTNARAISEFIRLVVLVYSRENNEIANHVCSGCLVKQSRLDCVMFLLLFTVLSY